MYGRLGVKSDQNLIDAFEHFVLEDCEDIKMSRMLKATLSRCTQYTNTQYIFFSLYMYTRQGWRSGESTRLQPMWPGFKSRRRRHMWVEFVVGSLPCSKRFFPGTPVFPSPQTPTIPNSNSIWNAQTRVNEFRHMNS